MHARDVYLVFVAYSIANVLDEPCSIQQISLSLAFLGARAAQLVFQVTWPMLFSSILFQHNCGWNILAKQGPHRHMGLKHIPNSWDPCNLMAILTYPVSTAQLLLLLEWHSFLPDLSSWQITHFCQLISRQETAGSLSLLLPSRSTARNGLRRRSSDITSENTNFQILLPTD